MPVSAFGRHVSALHADSDIGFSKEYEEVQRLSQSKECDFPFEHCKHPENKIKNRYLNIVACESGVTYGLSYRLRELFPAIMAARMRYHAPKD